MGKKRNKLIKEEIIKSFVSCGVPYEKAVFYAENLKGARLSRMLSKKSYNYRNKIAKQEFYERALSVDWKLKQKEIDTFTKRKSLLPLLEQKEKDSEKSYACLYIIVTYEGLVEKSYGVEEYLEKVLMKKSLREIEEYIVRVINDKKSFGKIGTIFMATSQEFDNRPLGDVMSDCTKEGKFVIYHGLPKTKRQFLLALLKLVVLIYTPEEKESALLSFCELVEKNIQIETVRKLAIKMSDKI